MDNWYEIITPDVFHDERGHIWTTYRQADMWPSMIETKFSTSVWGTLRGFHGDNRTWKLMSCIEGECHFIAYDLVSQQKIEVELDDSEKKLILIRPNVINAHLVTSPYCTLMYQQSAYYQGPDSQVSIRYDDPEINASWIGSEIEFVMSERDKNSEHIGGRKWNQHLGAFSSEK